MVDHNDTKRKKIGVLIDCLHESYQSTIWNGIANRAHELNVNLISYVATSQDRTSHFHVHYNIIRDFVSKSDIDGLIVFSGPISEHHGAEFAESYLEHFSHIPTICISAPVGDLPSVVVDNQKGIVDLVDHFVQVHALYKIAFLTGPAGHSEADERLEAYKMGLKRNKIPYRDELVIEGDFSKQCGNQAVVSLVEKDIAFDAIMSVNDKAAFGIIEELKRYKKHIPTEVAVTGFDDVTEASLSLPALTTVRQPLWEMGMTAIDNLLLQINGESFEKCTQLSAIPEYRRSCGCFADVIRASNAIMKQGPRQSKQDIVEAIYVNAMPYFQFDHPSCPSEKKLKSYLSDLVDSLIWDVNKAYIQEIFLNELDMLLFKFEEYTDNVSLMNVIVTNILGYLSSIFRTAEQLASATTILQQGHTLVREHRLNSAQTSFLEDTLFQLMIRETSQSMITTFEQRKLLQAISSSFPELNINSLVFAVYEKREDATLLTTENWQFPHRSRLLLGYDKKREVINYPRGNNIFLSKDLYPQGMYEDGTAGTFVFMPLFFEDEHLGYALFEYAPGSPLFMYEELRLHMSSALKSSFLMKELRIQSMLDELTGLHNRRGFMVEGNRMFRNRKKGGQRIMMFYADMDDLKVINDNYGHEEGDVAISGAASILRQAFREEDLVARIGGDEFIAMLVWDSEVEDLEARLMERLKISLTAYNQITEKPYQLSISLGVTATSPDDSISLEELMRQADEQLMAQKREKKKGRVVNAARFNDLEKE